MSSPSSLTDRLDKFAAFFVKVQGAKLEDFQREIVGELFAGRREILVTCGRGNGKTSLFAIVALHHLLTATRPKVYLAASATDQASIAYRAITDIIDQSPALQKRLRPLPGTKEIRRLDAPGMLKVISSDAPRAHGLMPSLCLVDELHAHQNDKLYVALRTALGKRADAQLVTISTAGYDQAGALAKLREAALKLPTQSRDGSRLRCESADGKFVMIEWACDPEDDFEDPAALKKANPATFVSEDFLREQIHSPGLHRSDLLRFHANMWVTTEEEWLPPHSWEGCFDEGSHIPDGSDVWIGVDVGLKRDKSAVVVIHYADDERIDISATIFDPPDDGERLDLSVVEQHLRDIAARHNVLGVAYDPWSFTRSAQILESEGLFMVEHPMTNARMVPASQRLYEAILAKRLRHDGDPLLAQHVLAGAQQQTERGWRLGKRKARNPQDALIALCLAFGVADIQEDQGAPVLEWIA